MINSISRRWFSRSLAFPFNASFAAPLQDGQFASAPARPVPFTLPRPAYARLRNQETPDLKFGAIAVHEPHEVAAIRCSSQLAARALSLALSHVRAGVTTDQIDALVHDFLVQHGAYPSTLNYLGFPKSVCTSVNEVVCHGVPDSRPLQEGDYVNIDVSCFLDGFHGDTSAMAFVGEVHPRVRELVEVTRVAMYKGIAQARAGNRYSDVGEAIQAHAHEQGLHVCPFCTGHGIGRDLHMAPYVYNWLNTETRRMEPGMTFTIEPILVNRLLELQSQIEVWQDQWTVAAPGVASAQWEHVVLVTEGDPEVLSLREGEEVPAGLC